jgi:hypothetical protein
MMRGFVGAVRKISGIGYGTDSSGHSSSTPF